MNQQDHIVASEGPPDPQAGELSAARAELATARQEVAALRQALAAARDRERLLGHELQHRVRNMLAVIRSIYRRTRETGASTAEFAEHFQGRLDAVARYQAHASKAGGAGIDLEDMLRDEFLAASCGDGPDCTIAGPPVRLSEKSTELMGLAFHELVTNSIKFGALGHGGTLAVEWSLREGEPGSLLHVRWTEAGVSPVVPAPRPCGFGRQFIEEALPYQLGATTSFHLKPGRMECSILLPLPGPDNLDGPAADWSLLLPLQAERFK